MVRLLGVLASISLVLASAGLPATIDCTSDSHLDDQSLRGTLRGQARSTQAGCTGRMMYVRTWIWGVSYGCSGERWQNLCYATSSSGNAVTSAHYQSYGTADASSTHEYREGESYTHLESRDKVLDAGSPTPREECDAIGHLWNDSTQICEINPDGPNGSPIIIATGVDASYKLTSADDGVLFDIDGDGVPEQIAWTPADAEIAFLALDRDGDSYITSGRELFGNFTLAGSSNGFDALRRLAMESNGGIKRGSVSSEDPLFAKLLLWTDSNHNGVSDPWELRPASEVLSDIGLAYQEHSRRDGHGNLYRFRGWVHLRTSPGRNRARTPAEDLARRRYIFDVFFARAR